MSIHPAIRPVRRMVQCEGIVSLAMPCFKWFLIYLITTPDTFLNQTHFVRLGIFHLELGKKHTFWLWEWGRISAPNFGDREPCVYTIITAILSTMQINYPLAAVLNMNIHDSSRNSVSIFCKRRLTSMSGFPTSCPQN